MPSGQLPQWIGRSGSNDSPNDFREMRADRRHHIAVATETDDTALVDHGVSGVDGTIPPRADAVIYPDNYRDNIQNYLELTGSRTVMTWLEHC